MVSPQGDDTNEGSQAQPFKTLQRAADIVQPGDIVLVEDGTYSAPGTILTIERGGSSVSWVWFKSRNRFGAKLVGMGNDTDTGISLRASFVRVEGFDISGMRSSGGSTQGIEAYSGGADTQIVGNHIHDIGQQCSTSVNGFVGIFVQQPRVVVDGNIVHDIGRELPGENGCTDDFNAARDHGVYLNGRDPGADGAIVRNNIFYNLRRGWSVQLYPGDLEDVRILHNTFAFDNPRQDGHIVLDATITDTTISNNIFHQPRGAALHIGSELAASNVVISHNITTAAEMLDAATPAGITLEVNTLSTDAMFVNVSAFDFRLADGSPAIDSGQMHVDGVGDVVGCMRPRGAGVDVGAYER